MLAFLIYFIFKLLKGSQTINLICIDLILRRFIKSQLSLHYESTLPLSSYQSLTLLSSSQGFISGILHKWILRKSWHS